MRKELCSKALFGECMRRAQNIPARLTSLMRVQDPEKPAPGNFKRSVFSTALAFVMILLCIRVQAEEAGPRVTLAERNIKLEVLFDKIKQQTGYTFLYNYQMLNDAKRISINVTNVSVENALDICFKEQPFSYQIKDRIIILTKAKVARQKADITAVHAMIPADVTGRIIDPSGQPINGVSVVVKGSKNGTVTDADGYYRISAPDKATLIFSYVGYQSKEITAEGRTTIDITLEPSTTIGNEVVVVGYGSRSKRTITGSVSNVDMSKQPNLPTTNITQVLRGKVAGVQFTDNGRPGQEGSILVRGRNSLSASSNPLIVLDGIIFNGSLADINPNDIQAIDILKDASSASIYGARAANGVILVTSKKGITEKPSISINAFSGISDPSYKVKLLTPDRYLQRVIDYRTQTGVEADPSKIANYLTKTEADNYAAGITHDPWDEAFQDGKINYADLSVSGRSKMANYYLSASLTDDHGLVFNDNQKRTSFRANIDTRIADWLTVGVNSTFAHRNLSGENASLENAYVSSPYGTWYYPDGEPTQYVVAEEQVSINPIRSPLLTTNSEIFDNLFSNFYARVNVPFIPGLEYRVNYSPNFRWHHNYNFFRQDKHLANNTTSASKLNEKTFDWLLENIVTYRKSIGRDHAFDVTLLYGRNHNEFESTTATAKLLSTEVLGYNDLSLGNVLTTVSSASGYEGISSMARLNYQYRNRYMATFTVRRDGSSVFAANNKFATFPSGSVAWIVSDEPFMKKSAFIDMLKLRVSYGSVGNQAISPYQSLSLSGITQYVYGDGGPTSIGVYPSTIGNDDLKWETTYKTNIGIDFSFFKGRLNGVLEAYNSKTVDLLVQRVIPTMTGFNNIFTNIGEVNNKGFDITLNSVNVRSGKFEWTSSVIFSTNKNKIVHLFGSDVDKDGKEDDDLTNNWFIGQPINSYYDYKIAGIYQEGDDIPAGYKPGWVKLTDMNGDKKIDTKDRTIIGSGANPKYRIGVTNNFRYGNLSLSVFVNAMQGWISPFSLLNPGTTGRSLNQLDDGWWTAENKSTTRASLVYTNPMRHGWYVSRDFVRIQDVSLMYDFPKSILDKLKASSLKVYLSARNLHTFTDWLGTDPESGGYSAGDLYPMPRTITLGLNVGF